MASGALADLLAIGVLGVAVFCAGRLALARAWRRPAGHEVDLVHVVMGVSMAGMLTGWLAGPWNDAWTVLFVASTAGFGWGVARQMSSGTTPASGAGHLSHFVASAAMLYMLVSMRWAPMGGSGMHMASGRSSAVLPAVVAVLLVGNAVLALAGSLLPAASTPAGQLAADRAMVPGSVAAAGFGRERVGLPGAGRADPSRVLAPRATAVCLVVMSLAMAYMFVTVRP